MTSEDYSMTPPLTPGLQEENTNDALDYIDMLESSNVIPPSSTEDIEVCSSKKLVMFDCHGTVTESSLLSSESYLKTKVLENILKRRYFLLDEFKENKLLDMPFSECIFITNMDHYFMKIRQILNQLEPSQKPSLHMPSNKTDVQEAISARTEVMKLFWYLKSFVNSHDAKDLLPEVAIQLYELLCFMGPLNQWPLPNGSNGHKESSSASVFFHLNLDIRWWILSLLFMISQDGPEVPIPSNIIQLTREDLFIDLNQNGSSTFDAAISFVIWDLISLLKKAFKKEPNSKSLSGFPCTCCHELACTLRAYIDFKAKLLKKKSFWELLRSWFIVLLKRKSDPHHHLTIFDNDGNYTLQEIIWIFFNISELYQWDVEAKQQPITSKEMSQCEPKLFRTILITIFGQNGKETDPIEEGDLRFYMQIFLKLVNLWKDDRTLRFWDCVVVVWEYMCKNLNNSFYKAGSSVATLATQSKTPQNLIHLVIGLDSKFSSVTNTETSWHTFLRIVVGMLERGDQEWRSLRGRIYSRFHEKKMGELSSSGIYNVSFLFLVTAWNGDLPSLCSKLCELLFLVPENDPSKMRMVFMGLLSIVILLNKKNHNLSTICEKLSFKLNRLSEICNSTSDVMQRRDFGQIFVFYCDTVQHILSSNYEMLSEEADLLDSVLASHINRASIVERNSIFNLLSCAIDKISKVSQKPHCIADGSSVLILTKFWEKFKKVLRDQSTSMTPSELLGPVVSKLILSSSKVQSISDRNSGVLKHHSSEMLSMLLTNDEVSHRHSCEVLSLLLDDPVEIEQLINVYPKLEEHSVCKFLSSYVLLGDIDEVQSACDAVLKLPSIQSIVQATSNDAKTTITLLFQKLGENHDAVQDFRDRILVREKVQLYVTSMERSLTVLMKKSFLPPHTIEATRLMGLIISKSSRFIYTKGKITCPLPSLLSSLILPTAIYSYEKPLSRAASDVISVLLPKVLYALVILQPVNGSDAYLSRSFRDIIVNYVYRYQVVTHPFLTFFTEEPDSSKVRRIFTQILMEHYVAKRKCPPVHLQLVLGLLLRLLGCDAENWNPILCELVFPNLLEVLLYIDELTTRRATTDLIQRIFEEVKDHSSKDNEFLLISMRNFVASQLCWSPTKVFRILSVLSVINKILIVDVLPHIVEQVRRTESKRGTGIDMGLRKGYQDLVNQLGVDTMIYSI